MKDQARYELDAPSTGSATSSVPQKRKRGFALMDPIQVREFARRGGVAAHVAGKAHEFTSEEARAAGRKGGMAASTERRASHSEATTTAGETTSSQASPPGR